MALQPSQTVTQAGITPAPFTPTASDTVNESSFGSNGIVVRITTTSTATNFSVTDPTTTGLGNAGTVTPTNVPTASVREFYVPRAALNQSGVATLNFSAQTGVSVEVKRW